MKTSELTGALLDYWVARAEGMEPYYYGSHEDALLWMRQGRFSSATATPRYSTDWTVAGPIIERERIAIESSNTHHDGDPWHAIHDGIFDYGAEGIEGPTPLVAAMRAYVLAKFGDEVPDSHEAAQPAAEP